MLVGWLFLESISLFGGGRAVCILFLCFVLFLVNMDFHWMSEVQIAKCLCELEIVTRVSDSAVRSKSFFFCAQCVQCSLISPNIVSLVFAKQVHGNSKKIEFI